MGDEGVDHNGSIVLQWLSFFCQLIKYDFVTYIYYVVASHREITNYVQRIDMAYFNVLSEDFLGGTEDNNKNPQ